MHWRSWPLICIASKRVTFKILAAIFLTSPSNSSMQFHLHIYWDSKAAAYGVTVIGVALGERGEVALLD